MTWPQRSCRAACGGGARPGRTLVRLDQRRRPPEAAVAEAESARVQRGLSPPPVPAQPRRPVAGTLCLRGRKEQAVCDSGPVLDRPGFGRRPRLHRHVSRGRRRKLTVVAVTTGPSGLHPAPAESLTYGCPVGLIPEGAACRVSIDRPVADGHLGDRRHVVDRIRNPTSNRWPLTFRTACRGDAPPPRQGRLPSPGSPPTTAPARQRCQRHPAAGCTNRHRRGQCRRSRRHRGRPPHRRS